MKIMIVEDERSIQEMMVETLAKWGYEAAAVEDYEAVLSFFLQEQPHLVIMDINLPAFDGFYWCSRLREVSKVPILFVSSRNTPLDMVMSMNMGGDDFIQKPFYSDVLVAKINALLRRTYDYTEIHARVIEHNGVVLHLDDANISHGERKAALTKTEFVILHMLMRSKGAIVSRHKLMRSLWEDESFVDDNTLTVNIARLRKKLEELDKDDFIVTRKGQGYMVQ